jgi:hypothetical protein
MVYNYIERQERTKGVMGKAEKKPKSSKKKKSANSGKTRAKGTNSGKGFVTLKSDGIGWNIRPVPKRIVALGDVHGDIAGLACILRDRGLIDKKGRWTGERAHLVLSGDLVGGRNARLLLQMVMRLGEEAAAAGGGVHSLLGNHDIQVFFKEYQNHEGKTMFLKHKVDGSKAKSLRDAFKGETVFARWLRERNALIRIGPTIFAHAGLNVWGFKHHPERMNATIRAWIRYWQGVGTKPDLRTQWAALGSGADWSTPSAGPLWTRSYRVDKKKKAAARKKNTSAPDAEELSKLLKKYRARRLVVGHAPVARKEILLSHPFYGRKVIMLDTRISQKQGGRLSCLEIRGDDLRAHYPKRNGIGTKIQELELKRLKKGTSK